MVDYYIIYIYKFILKSRNYYRIDDYSLESKLFFFFPFQTYLRYRAVDLKFKSYLEFSRWKKIIALYRVPRPRTKRSELKSKRQQPTTTTLYIRSAVL